MASPQLENGYLRIANEIAQHLVKAPLLGAEFQVLLFTIIKTYGFNKKKDWISLSQFEKGTGLSRPTVVKALKNLIIKKLLFKSQKFEFVFNKDWEQWVVKTPLLVKSKGVYGKDALTKIGKDALTHKRHNTNTKDNSTLTKVKDAHKKKYMKNSFKYNEKNSSDTFEDSIDIETGETNKPKEPTRQKAINYIKDYFSIQCEKKIGIKPIMTYKQNIVVANLFKKGLRPSQITDVIDWWFNNQTDKGMIIQINTCLSSYWLNNYQITTEKKLYETK